MATMLKTIQSRFSARAMANDIAFCGVTGLFADAVCQMGVEGRRLPTEWRWRRQGEEIQEGAVDARRLVAQTAFNAGWVGGVIHVLYQAYPFGAFALARLLPPSTALRARLLSDTTLTHALGCAMVDNLHTLFLFNPAYFFGAGLLQGDSVAACSANFRDEWFSSWGTATWCQSTRLD